MFKKLFYLFMLLSGSCLLHAQVDLAAIMSGNYKGKASFDYRNDKKNGDKENVAVKIEKTGKNKVRISSAGVEPYEMEIKKGGRNTIEGQEIRKIDSKTELDRSIKLTLEEKSCSFYVHFVYNGEFAGEKLYGWQFEGTTSEQKPDNLDWIVNEGDELTLPYKNKRVKATVLEVSDEFVKMNVRVAKENPTPQDPSDVTQSNNLQDFKTKFDNKEILKWSDMVEYLRTNRFKFPDALLQEVWNNALKEAKEKGDSVVRDPNTPEKILKWTKGKNRYDQWHMGHKSGHEYKDLVDRLANEQITWEAFKKEYFDPSNYWPEDPANNMSHEYEAEPEITKEQKFFSPY